MSFRCPPHVDQGTCGLSVELSEWPEVYSLSPEDPTQGLGYCFGFARPEEIETWAAGFQDSVTSSLLPARRSLDDELARDPLMNGGFVTVVRLPLTRPGALDVVRESLTELRSMDVPLLLFLRKFEAVEVLFVGGEGESFTLGRKAVPIDLGVPVGMTATRVETAGSEYVVFSQVIPADRMRCWIRESIEAGQLSEKWGAWDSDGEVSLGLPLSDDPVKEGRLYTYLPMEASAPCRGPLNALATEPPEPNEAIAA